MVTHFVFFRIAILSSLSISGGIVDFHIFDGENVRGLPQKDSPEG
ncbi:hypothetical protein M272_17660 [Vibrio natriegens NBRC 15636 = ATCC 14048 = DSM 759]|nr:hypothetical protein M272_17660 [Vibrio natriegens NBRC 15636 = ATCC 14048 = DSM 759]